MYRGDLALGATLDFKFTTRRFTTGVPFTLAGTPSLAAYVDNGTTEITAGITLTVDFDGVTGLNHVRVVASSGNGYAAGTNVQIVIAVGTVDSVSVVGEVVGEFSIEARSALRPTVAARTLDVTATGAAGIDWANVENPTTVLALTGTTIDPAQVVASVAGAVGSVTGNVGGNVNGNVVGTVASVVGNVGGNLVGNVNGNVVGSVGSVTADVGITQAGADKVWLSAARTLTSFGTLVADVATAVWGAAVRVLTAGTNIALAKGVGLTGLNDIAAADVWASVTRTLTAGTNIVLAKGVGVTGFTDLSAADVRAAVGLAAADLDTQLGGIQTDLTTALANQTTINGNVLARATPAQVNAEMVDALNVDTYGEPTGVPPATTTLVQKIGRLHMALRNEVTVDANTGKKQFHDDGGAVEWEKDFTDAAGVYNETEANAP